MIADYPPAVIGMLVIVQKPEQRAEMVLVDEFHEGMQFLKPVLQRGPGQYDGILRTQPLDRLGTPCFPVFDALGFIQYHQVRRPAMDQFQIPGNNVIIDDFIEGISLVQGFTIGV